MIDFNENTYYDQLVLNNVATEEEINLVTDINGWSIETLDEILYARTGNRDWEQYCYENGVENVFEEESDDFDEDYDD